MTFVEMVNQLLISNANIPLFFIFLLSSNAIFFHYCPVNCSNSAKATRSCPKGSYAGTVPQYEKLTFFIQTNRPRVAAPWGNFWRNLNFLSDSN